MAIPLTECPKCKGTLQLEPIGNQYECEYCGSTFPGPPRQMPPPPPPAPAVHPSQRVVKLDGNPPRKGCCLGTLFKIIVYLIIFWGLIVGLSFIAFYFFADETGVFRLDWLLDIVQNF